MFGIIFMFSVANTFKIERFHGLGLWKHHDPLTFDEDQVVLHITEPRPCTRSCTPLFELTRSIFLTYGQYTFLNLPKANSFGSSKVLPNCTVLVKDCRSVLYNLGQLTIKFPTADIYLKLLAVNMLERPCITKTYCSMKVHYLAIIYEKNKE